MSWRIRLLFLLPLLVQSLCADDRAPSAASSDSRTLGAFAGRWDLTIASDGKELPSWLEVTNQNGTPHASFVGRWGHMRALPKVEIKGDEILFVSPKDEEGSKNDLVFRGKLSQKGKERRLNGTADGPDGAKWSWTGVPAPVLPSTPSPQWGPSIELFNGRDFNGWTFGNPGRAPSWKVENGCLVNAGPGANLITTRRFQDFKLHIEVNCPSNANSGIYLRGRYEVQVEDDSILEPNNHHMGAVYGYLAPKPEQPRKPGVWQTFDITLLGRWVTVVQNGQTIIDHKEIPGITGGALDSHEAQPGPFYLQGDHGGIAYRNIRVTPAIASNK